MKTDKVFIRKSKIHENGVFANKDFKKGDVVLHWDTSHKLTKKQAMSASEKDKKYITYTKRKFITMQEPEKYLNHSCNANTKVSNFCDVAIKKIKCGEEITGDYSKELPGGISLKCNCKINCRKVIKRR